MKDTGSVEKELFEKNKLVSQLMKMPHGDLSKYKDALPLANADKDLFAHFIAWNNEKSAIRDSKMALPVIALRTAEKALPEYIENAIAALMTLNPRDLYKAYLFSKELTTEGKNIKAGARKILQDSIKEYLTIREANTKWWDNAVVRNRNAILALYTVSHIKPSDRAQKVLFDKQYPKGSVFEIIKNLKNMTPLEAGSNILKYKIPMPIIVGAGIKLKDNQDLLLALVEGMTGNEILNNTNMLKQMGAFNYAAVKASYDKAIERAQTDKRVNIYKASKAVEKVDEKIAKKLISIQREKEKDAPKLCANVLILADCSGSMEHSLKVAKQIAGVISSSVEGEKFLVFFNINPRFFDITGKSYDEICSLTKEVRAFGGTSIGCGLSYIKDKNKDVDLIIIVSDGADNANPYFHDAYKSYSKKMGIDPTIYFFRVNGEPDKLSSFCKIYEIPVEKFDIDSTFDYYSLPNLIKTIKISRFDLINEILDTPLLTLKDVFTRTGE